MLLPQQKKIVQAFSPMIQLCTEVSCILEKLVIDTHDKESPAPNSLKTWTSALPMGENMFTAYLLDSTFERKGK